MSSIITAQPIAAPRPRTESSPFGVTVSTVPASTVRTSALAGAWLSSTAGARGAFGSTSVDGTSAGATVLGYTHVVPMSADTDNRPAAKQASPPRGIPR